MNYREKEAFPIEKLMIDGTDTILDGSGQPYCAVQRDDEEKKLKYCQVYRLNKEGHWEHVIDVLKMYGAPKLKIWAGGKGIVFGSTRAGVPCYEDIDGFVPVKLMPLQAAYLPMIAGGQEEEPGAEEQDDRAAA